VHGKAERRPFKEWFAEVPELAGEQQSCSARALRAGGAGILPRAHHLQRDRQGRADALLAELKKSIIHPEAQLGRAGTATIALGKKLPAAKVQPTLGCRGTGVLALWFWAGTTGDPRRQAADPALGWFLCQGKGNAQPGNARARAGWCDSCKTSSVCRMDAFATFRANWQFHPMSETVMLWGVRPRPSGIEWRQDEKAFSSSLKIARPR